jgi:hypothetical protein
MISRPLVSRIQRFLYCPGRGMPGPWAAVVVLSLHLPAVAWALTTEAILISDGEAGNRLGFSVASIGDMNGDGYADFISGAIGADGGDGGANIYFGGPALDAEPDLQLFGSLLEQLGTSVDGAGDVNGDGYDDVIIGGPKNPTGGADTGRALIYFGGPVPDNISDVTLTGSIAGDNFGYSVAGAGDMNGDGFDDVIIGVPLGDILAGVDGGRAQIFLGGAPMNNVSDLTLSAGVSGERFGDSVAGAGDVNGDGFADVIAGASTNDVGFTDAGAAYLYLGGPSLNNTVDLTFNGTAANEGLGESVAGGFDMNHDGFSDVAIGADEADGTATNAGRVTVYFGGISLNNVADFTVNGTIAGEYMGEEVSAADLNGDGFDDLIAAAKEHDGFVGDGGRIYVFFGAASPNTTVDITLGGSYTSERFGEGLAGVGDLDGDGRDEFVVGADGNDAVGTNSGRLTIFATYPFRIDKPAGGEQWVAGATETVRWRGRDFADIALSTDGGATWSTLIANVGGDLVNSQDIVVPGPTTELARIRVSTNGATVSDVTAAYGPVFRIVEPHAPPAAVTTLAFTPAGTVASQFLGECVADLGDINGDGYDDLIVGAPGYSANQGRAYIYLGGPEPDATPDLTLTGEGGSGEFGARVAGCGDVNGDGFDEWMVAAPSYSSSTGRVYFYLGGTSLNGTADLTLTGSAAADQFGRSIGSAGDFNADGYGDFFVGAPFNDLFAPNGGTVFVYYGGANGGGFDGTFDTGLTGDGGPDQLGWSASGAGDVNGDGFDDMVVGAFQNDAGGTNAGRAYVFFGAATHWTGPLEINGAAANNSLGFSVSGSGDVNGDGYADIVVGSPNASVGGTNRGRIDLFLGGPAMDDETDGFLYGEESNDLMGFSVSGSGDVNDDGYADMIAGSSGHNQSGAAYVFYGGPGADMQFDQKLRGTLYLSSELFGGWVSNAGDLDGNGFDDLVIGARGNNVGGTNAGKVFVRLANRFAVEAPLPGVTWNVGATKDITWFGAERADVWLSSNGGDFWSLLRSNEGGAPENHVTLTIPHQPTRFAKIKITAHDPLVSGSAESDSLFTIQASIALLNLSAQVLEPASGGGVVVRWNTRPGPDDLAGYRLERKSRGAEWLTLSPLVRETSYHDASGTAGMSYRLSGVNGLGEELLLGETSLAVPAGLSAWPLPYRGGELNVLFLAAGGGSSAGPVEATVDLFDVSGHRVRRIAAGEFPLGVASATWDGRDDSGTFVPSGVYFLHSQAGGSRARMKIVVSR